MNFKGRDFGKSNTILRIVLSRTSGISGTPKTKRNRYSRDTKRKEILPWLNEKKIDFLRRLR